jgi:hypothetical protein
LATSAELSGKSQSLAQREEDREKVTQELEQAAQVRRQLEQDRAQFEQDRAKLEHNGAQRTECEAKREALEERELQLESQALDLADQVAAASARAIELDAHREQLAAERASLEEGKQRLQQQQVELDARAAELDAKAAELKALREKLMNEAAAGPMGEIGRCDIEESTGETPAPPSDKRYGKMPAEGPRPQSVVVTSAWQSPEALQQENLEHLVDDAVPMEGSSENPPEAPSVDSVLSRLVKAGLWRGDEGLDSNPKADNAAAESGVAAKQMDPPRPVHAHGHEEESIESYMDRLMKRVRGDSTSMEGKSRTIVQAVEEAAPPSGATPDPVTPAPPAEVEEAAEYSPRRPAPELSSMSAMRELANSAARSAIDKHVRKHTGKQATGKLFGAFLTVCCSVVLAYWAWHEQSLPATVGAVIGGCAGLYWTFAAVRRLFILMKLNRPEEELPAAENATGEKTSSVEEAASAEVTP